MLDNSAVAADEYIATQVARNPIEVLWNINWNFRTRVVYKDLADVLMDVAFAADEYSRITKTSMEDVKIVTCEQYIDGIGVRFNVPQTSRAANFITNKTSGSQFEHIARVNQMYARWFMQDDNIRAIGQFIQMMDWYAQTLGENLHRQGLHTRYEFDGGDLSLKESVWLGYDYALVRMQLDEPEEELDQERIVQALIQEIM